MHRNVMAAAIGLVLAISSTPTLAQDARDQ